MTPQQLVQIAIYVAVPLALVRPVGGYLTRVYKGEATLFGRLFRPLERLLCRLAGVPAGPGPLPREAEMAWQRYILCLLAWNGVGVISAHALKYLQAQLLLALTPEGQALVQRTDPVTQNFFVATTGLAVLTVLVRGLARPAAQTVGNFWIDLIRGTLYILLPLTVLVLLLSASKGIVLALAKPMARMLSSLEKDS